MGFQHKRILISLCRNGLRHLESYNLIFSSCVIGITQKQITAESSNRVFYFSIQRWCNLKLLIEVGHTVCGRLTQKNTNTSWPLDVLVHSSKQGLVSHRVNGARALAPTWLRAPKSIILWKKKKKWRRKRIYCFANFFQHVVAFSSSPINLAFW